MNYQHNTFQHMVGVVHTKVNLGVIFSLTVSQSSCHLYRKSSQLPESMSSITDRLQLLYPSNFLCNHPSVNMVQMFFFSILHHVIDTSFVVLYIAFSVYIVFLVSYIPFSHMAKYIYTCIDIYRLLIYCYIISPFRRYCAFPVSQELFVGSSLPKISYRKND